MKEQFVTYKIALVLKKLGFDEPCCGYYGREGTTYGGNVYYYSNPFSKYAINSIIENKKYCTAPLWQQAIDWFRNKHKIDITPQHFLNGYFCYTIDDMKSTEKSRKLFSEFETYEKAREQAVLKAIEMIKNNK